MFNTQVLQHVIDICVCKALITWATISNRLLIFNGGDKSWLSMSNIQWHKHNMETCHHTLRSFLKQTTTKKMYTPWRQLITSKMMLLEKVINIMYTDLPKSSFMTSLQVPHPILYPTHFYTVQHHPNSPSVCLFFLLPSYYHVLYLIHDSIQMCIL